MHRHILIATLLILAAAPLLQAAKSNTPLAEDFKNNRAQWPWVGTDDTTTSSIKNGTLTWHARGEDLDSYQKTAIEIELDSKSDYRLTATLRILSGPEGQSCGIQWVRNSDPLRYHEFTLEANGTFYARTYENEDTFTLVPDQKLANFTPNEFTEITVDKIGDAFYFSANGTHFATAPAHPIQGKLIAAKTDNGITAEFDKIYVDYLSPAQAANVRQNFLDAAKTNPTLAQPLFETFADNSNDWPFIGEDDDTLIEIADGILFYENFSLENETKQTSIPVQINPELDFEIDLTIKFLSGTENQAYGLAWGRNTDGARHYFGVSGDQNYMIDVYDGSKWIYDTTWTGNKSTVHPTGEDNLLSVRKIGDTVYNLINGNVVYKYPFTKLYGNKIGVFLPQGSAIEASQLKVSYILEDSQQLATQLEDKLYAHQLAAGPALEDFHETFDDNSNNWYWLEPNEDRTVSFENGTLFYNNHSPKTQYSTILKKAINPAADYQISLTFTHIGKAEDNLVGIQWGRSTDGNSYHIFGLAQNGHYILIDRKDSKSENTIPWTKIDLVKKGPNTLQVRKLGDQIFLFINDTLVAQTHAPEIYGEFLGMSIAPEMGASFDDLKLAYLDHTPAQSLAALQELDQQLYATYQSGKLKGAYHPKAKKEADQAQALAKRAEEKKLSEAEHLDDSDWKKLAKVRKQFGQAYRARVLGSWGRPVEIKGDYNNSHRIYYNYKLKGRKQYYYEFQITYVSSQFDMHGKRLPLEEKYFAITNITLTDRMW